MNNKLVKYIYEYSYDLDKLNSLIIEQNLSVNDTDGSGLTPIIAAVLNNNFELVSLLNSKGAVIDTSVLKYSKNTKMIVLLGSLIRQKTAKKISTDLEFTELPKVIKNRL